jgi:DUF1680 family protein
MTVPGDRAVIDRIVDGTTAVLLVGASETELAIPVGAELEAVNLEDYAGLGRTVGIEVQASVLRQPASDGWPYSTVPPEEVTTTQLARAFAIPYFQWDNRDGGAMRIWVPTASRTD